MTDTPALPAPVLPTEGGSWVQLSDGRLVREEEALAILAPMEAPTEVSALADPKVEAAVIKALDAAEAAAQEPPAEPAPRAGRRAAGSTTSEEAPASLASPTDPL